MGQDSVIRVEVEAEDDVVPVAEVFFIAYPGNVDDDIDDDAEILELGKFTDFDRLFDALSLAADQAEEWEAQLLAFDDDDDFDDYQDFGESFEDDLEDDSEDE